MSQKKFRDLRKAARNLYIIKQPRCTFDKFYKAVKKDYKAGRLKFVNVQNNTSSEPAT